MDFEVEKNLSLNRIREFYELKDDQVKNLEDFVQAVLQENQKHNFIGKSTISNIWNRHILDSAQLIKFIENKNLKFADFGSGAGFPGMVLSILGLREIHLIEKSFRKADFLRRARVFSGNKVFANQTALEDLIGIEFDCIVSRALAPLDKLLTYTQKFLKKDGYCLFLKGRNLPVEIKAAEKLFKFQYELYPSLTSDESSIIKISGIVGI